MTPLEAVQQAAYAATLLERTRSWWCEVVNASNSPTYGAPAAMAVGCAWGEAYRLLFEAAEAVSICHAEKKPTVNGQAPEPYRCDRPVNHPGMHMDRDRMAGWY